MRCGPKACDCCQARETQQPGKEGEIEGERAREKREASKLRERGQDTAESDTSSSDGLFPVSAVLLPCHVKWNSMRAESHSRFWLIYCFLLTHSCLLAFLFPCARVFLFLQYSQQKQPCTIRGRDVDLSVLPLISPTKASHLLVDSECDDESWSLWRKIVRQQAVPTPSSHKPGL